MKLSQFALQCYTIRDHCQTESDFASAMRKVSDIGYTAVQISALGPIPAQTIRQICDDHGLTICATHEDSQKILEDPEPIFDHLRTLGCRDTAYPYPTVDRSTAGFAQLAEQLEIAVGRFADVGFRLSYHNHALEFVKYDFGTVMDMLFERVPSMPFEIDTYWVQVGGASPADWCSRCTGRLPLLHLKDYAIRENDAVRMAAIGDGNLNWKDIIARAGDAGCEWFIFEQDRDWVEDDPFNAAKRSYDFVSRHLARQ